AAKTGALGNRHIVQAVADIVQRFDFPLVVDPVMISKHGAPLLSPDACEALKTRLVPLAYLLTPNLAEAAALTQQEIGDVGGMRRAARQLCEMGAKAVLVKGGHLAGDATDVLFDGREWLEFTASRIVTPHTHGTGCTYSAAITAELAKGSDLKTAVSRAKHFITEAIRAHPRLGGGSGPVNHNVAPRGV
ncbi:MAG: bifunctional hydroxymethylpyrimidine kinase/phosphomethylpyrimidine kinase, partial [Verrucomicrobiota bacterium]